MKIKFDNVEIDFEKLTGEQWCNLLSEDNPVLPNNDSAFYWLLATNAGQAIINKSTELQDKLAELIINGNISVDTLTQLVQPNNISAFFLLLATDAGQAIINKSVKLQNKLAELIINGNIPATALTQLLQPNNISAFCLLLATNAGRAIINNRDKLQDKLAELIINGNITTIALTQLIQPDNDSVFYWLLATNAGQAIINKSAKLQDKLAELIINDNIPATALTQLVQPNNISAFYWFLASNAGQAIINKSTELQDKLAELIINSNISVDTLTQLVKPDNDSVFCWLLAGNAGQAIINKSTELQNKLAELIIDNKIPINVLCRLNENPLFYLFNTQAGRVILSRNQKLRQKISTLFSEYKELAGKNEKLFNEKLEDEFPGLNELAIYIYGPQKGDTLKQNEREERIGIFEEKFGKNQLKTCPLTLGTIILPVIATFISNNKECFSNYELTAFIKYIKQIDAKKNGSITGDIIVSDIYQKLNLNQVVNLSEYNIPDAPTRLFIISIVFDTEYVKKFYETAKELWRLEQQPQPKMSSQ